jgi:hypothetical protein
MTRQNQGKSNNSGGYERSFSRPAEVPSNELSDGSCAFLITMFLLQSFICFMYAVGGFTAEGDDWDMIFGTIAVVIGVGGSIVVHTFLRKRN